jgi:hypothetical protein
MNWYRDTQIFLRKEFDDWKLFAALLAACSPQTSVTKSWNMALIIYKQHKAGEEIYHSSIMGCHTKNIQRALHGNELSGSKVRAFYQNLIGNEQAVTIDTWMLKMFGWFDRHKRTPSLRQYERLEQAFQTFAWCKGIAPARLQALLWIKCRERNGYKAITYVGELK